MKNERAGRGERKTERERGKRKKVLIIGTTDTDKGKKKKRERSTQKEYARIITHLAKADAWHSRWTRGTTY